MSLFTRIEFANDGAGTGSYTLPINPIAIEADDSKYIAMTNCLGSEPAAYENYHDDRPIEFIWKDLPADSATYSGLVTTLQSYIFTEKYVRLNSVQPLFRSLFTSTGYNGPYIVYNFSKKVRSGGGTFFEEIKLTLIKKGS
jgi:hypothetical protein